MKVEIVHNSTKALAFKPGTLVLALAEELIVEVEADNGKSISGVVVHPGKTTYKRYDRVPDFLKKAFDFECLNGQVILSN